MKKKCDVVMLPTEDWENTKNQICLFGYGLNIAGCDNIGYPVQHLYIMSDDEIKERNDWLLVDGHLRPLQITDINTDKTSVECDNGLAYQYDKCSKIIATTDKLCVKDNGGDMS